MKVIQELCREKSKFHVFFPFKFFYSLIDLECPIQSQKKCGDKAWLEKILAALAPNHRFFQMHSPTRSRSLPIVTVQNHGGIFT